MASELDGDGMRISRAGIVSPAVGETPAKDEGTACAEEKGKEDSEEGKEADGGTDDEFSRQFRSCSRQCASVTSDDGLRGIGAFSFWTICFRGATDVE
jgi:hypothetical protein